MFYHSITKFVFIFKSLSDSSPEATRHFFTESVVTTTHEQNIICSKSHLDSTTHEQTIICRQLFAGHVVGSRPMKRKKKMHRMIKAFIIWLAPRASKKNQVVRCDWLPERTTTRCTPQEKFLPKPYNKSFTDQGQDDRILASFFFGEFMDLDFVSVHKHAKKTWPIFSRLDLTLGQLPIFTALKIIPLSLARVNSILFIHSVHFLCEEILASVNHSSLLSSAIA